MLSTMTKVCCANRAHSRDNTAGESKSSKLQKIIIVRNYSFFLYPCHAACGEGVLSHTADFGLGYCLALANGMHTAVRYVMTEQRL